MSNVFSDCIRVPLTLEQTLPPLGDQSMLHHRVAHSSGDVCFHSETGPAEWCPDLKQTYHDASTHLLETMHMRVRMCALTL